MSIQEFFRGMTQNTAAIYQGKESKNIRTDRIVTLALSIFAILSFTAAGCSIVGAFASSYALIQGLSLIGALVCSIVGYDLAVVSINKNRVLNPSFLGGVKALGTGGKAVLHNIPFELVGTIVLGPIYKACCSSSLT